jgi:hypothetical protein
VNAEDCANPVVIASLTSPPYLDFHDIKAVGNYVYVAAGYSGLKIIDISLPTQPTIVGTYNSPGTAGCVDVSGNYAYVGAYTTLNIVDISNPTTPYEVSSYTPNGKTIDVQVSGSYVYIATYDFGGGENGIEILDITNPSNPSFASNINLGDEVSICEITIKQDNIYVSVFDELIIIDITNPFSPQIIAEYDEIEPLFGITKDDNFIYVTSPFNTLYNNCIWILNVENPASPNIAGYYFNEGDAQGIEIRDNYAYIANGDLGLRILNISDLDNIRESGYLFTPGTSNRIRISGDYAFVAYSSDSYQGSLKIFDISDTSNIVEVSNFNTPGNATDVAIQDEYCYIVDIDSGLYILNISDPTNPTQIGNFVNGTGAIDVVGDIAYVGSNWIVMGTNAYSIFYTLNIQQPNNPQILDTLQFLYSYEPYGTRNIVVRDDFAYISVGYALHIIQVSNPNDIFETGYITMAESPTRVALMGDLAFTCGYSALHAVSVSNPYNPLFAGY